MRSLWKLFFLAANPSLLADIAIEERFLENAAFLRRQRVVTLLEREGLEEVSKDASVGNHSKRGMRLFYRWILGPQQFLKSLRWKINEGPWMEHPVFQGHDSRSFLKWKSANLGSLSAGSHVMSLELEFLEKQNFEPFIPNYVLKKREAFLPLLITEGQKDIALVLDATGAQDEVLVEEVKR